jgi:hypothetical protein
MTATAWTRRRHPGAPAYHLGRAADRQVTALTASRASVLAKASAHGACHRRPAAVI